MEVVACKQYIGQSRLVVISAVKFGGHVRSSLVVMSSVKLSDLVVIVLRLR